MGNRTTMAERCPAKVLKVSRSEYACMKRVMEETDGAGGPWFSRFQIIMGVKRC